MTANSSLRIVACLLGALAWSTAWAADEILHARVSYESGGGLVKGTADAEWSYATTNTIVLPGDTLWIDKSGTLELEMAGGSFLRLADRSKVEIAALPPNGEVRGITGAFYVQRVSRSTGDFIFRTPACATEIDRDSQVRVDVLSDGATTVTVRWGRATIRANGGEAVYVTSGKRSYIDPGYLPSAPMPYDRSEEDAFDAWNRERARLLAVGSNATVLPVATTSAPMGVSDLASYGDWVYVDDSYYWRPTVIVDYVPYRYGHWSFIPGCGYSWADQYPFAYVTSHYGRWWHHDQYGWLWHYGDVWGPAWVASVRYGPNFVWSPLDPWDHPVVFGSANFTVGGVQFSIGASSYSVADSLLYGPCSVYGLTPNIVNVVNTGDIFIWNINLSDRGTRRLPFAGSSTLVRDYSPRRVIRGPDTIGPQAVTAVQRARALETTATAAVGASVAPAGSRTLRTASGDNTGRSARLRSVTVTADALRDTTDATQRAQRAYSRIRMPGSSEARMTRSVPQTNSGEVSASEAGTRSTRYPALPYAERPRTRGVRSVATEQPASDSASTPSGHEGHADAAAEPASASPGRFRTVSRDDGPDQPRSVREEASETPSRTEESQSSDSGNTPERARTLRNDDTPAGARSGASRSRESSGEERPMRTTVESPREAPTRSVESPREVRSEPSREAPAPERERGATPTRPSRSSLVMPPTVSSPESRPSSRAVATIATPERTTRPVVEVPSRAVVSEPRASSRTVTPIAADRHRISAPEYSPRVSQPRVTEITRPQSRPSIAETRPAPLIERPYVSRPAPAPMPQMPAPRSASSPQFNYPSVPERPSISRPELSRSFEPVRPPERSHSSFSTEGLSPSRSVPGGIGAPSRGSSRDFGSSPVVRGRR